MQHAVVKKQRSAAAGRLSDQHQRDAGPAGRAGPGTLAYSPTDLSLRLSVEAAQLLGLPQAAATHAVSLDELLGHLHPDDRMEVSLRLQTAHLAGGGFEREFRLAGGARFRLAGAPAPGAGGAPGVSGTIVAIPEADRDGTDPAAGQTALALAVEAAGAGIWSLDLDTLVLTLSPKSIRMYGLPEDHAGIVSHEEWLTLVDDDTAADANARIGNVTDLETTHELEMKLRGSARWLRMLGRLSRDAEGRPIILSGLQFDVTESKEMELALREAEHRFQVAEEAAAIGCYATSSDERAYCSPGFYRMVGLPVDTPWLDFSAFLELVHEEDRPIFLGEIQRALAEGTNYNAEVRVVRADTGEVRWMHSRAKFITDADGNVIRSIGANVDITDRKRAEDSLRRSEAFNRSIVEASADGVSFLDFDGRLLFMNQSGLKAAEIDDIAPLLGRQWTDFWPEKVRDEIERELERARRGAIGHFTACNATAKGRDRWWDVIVTATPAIEEDRGKLLVIARDVTEHRRTVDSIEWAANHDALTGLANRRSFRESFTLALRDARRASKLVGLLLIDLDHFKEANDMFGHDAGDTILKSVATCLRDIVGEAGSIARLGGDEFAIILKDISRQSEISAVGDAILERMREPLLYRERMLSRGASLGAAIYPLHGTTVETLLKNADLAVYTAKSDGRSSVRIFHPTMRAAMRKHAAQMRLARSALARGAIMPFYQSKVRLADRSVAGFEALLRISDSKGHIRPPGDIAAAFEDADLSRTIGETMRAAIIFDMRRWLDQGLAFGHVSMNVSAAELRREDFVARLMAALAENEIPSGMLELEITETVFFDQGNGQIERSLRSLHNAGVRIALDDFGTGYASLSHLKRFPVSTLKIDQSFVRRVEQHHEDAVIVRTLLGLGQNLGIDVVAEGVETEANAGFLLKEGCLIGQGYLFSRPIAAAEVPALLA